MFAKLGQPLFNAPLPNGWADDAAEWSGPDQMLRRIDWAYGFAARLGGSGEPMQLADTSLGPLLRPATAEQIRRAGIAAGRDDLAADLPRIPEALTAMLTRRTTLLGLSAAAMLGRTTLALAAAPTERRFVVVILRGALDGMAAVVPYGDPNLRGLRGPLAPPDPGQEGGLLDLGGFYGLHPVARRAARDVRGGRTRPGPCGCRPVPDAQPFRGPGLSRKRRRPCPDQRLAEPRRAGAAWTRSMRARRSRSGSRCHCCCGDRPRSAPGRRHPSATPTPTSMPASPPLHAADPVTGPAIVQGLRERGFAAEVLADPDGSAPRGGGFLTLATAAGRFLRAPDGPRIAALEIGGWDTHIDQARRLSQALRQLDDGLVALKDCARRRLGQTAVLVMTEFGRTARPNGTAGTDHGTGTVAFVLGGAVAGGTVRGTWPGLGVRQAARQSRPAADHRPALARQGAARRPSRP